MPAVSVVIPVYNVEAYLPACLDSVLGQTLSDIEVICIDDCSPDGSGAICDRYAAEDPRVRVLHLPENHMQGYGRNRGLEMAGGKYVYFLDSDDMIEQDALERASRICDESALDGLFFDSQMLVEHEGLRRYADAYPAFRTGVYEDRVYGGEELYNAFVDQSDFNVYIQRQIWRRAFLLEEGICFPEGVEHEDELFSFEAILAAKRVRYTPERWFIHRYRDASVMTRPPHPKDFHGYFINYCKMVDFTAERRLDSPQIDFNISHMYECMAMFFEIFMRQEDPEAWFRGTPYLTNYRFYCALRQTEERSAAFDRTFFTPLRPYERLYLYGAGRVASSLFMRLSREGFLVEGFAVTSMEGNPERLFGRRVIPISELPPQPGAIMVVAMSAAMHAEAAAMLEDRGWPYFLYAKNVLTGPFDAAQGGGR